MVIVRKEDQPPSGRLKKGKTVGQVLKEATKGSKNAKEKRENFKKKYGKDKLKIKVKSKAILANLKVSIKAGNPNLKENLEILAREKKVVEGIKSCKGYEKIIGKIETIGDLRKVSVRKLIHLEDRFEGILLYAFTDIADSTKKIDFKNWKGYSNPKPGTRIKVHFRGNREAYRKIGAGDMLSPAVRCMTVLKNGDPNQARTSKRRIGLKGQNVVGRGFHDRNGYMAIFTGDVIIIGGVNKPQEGIDLGFDKRFRNNKSELDEDSYKKYAKSLEARKDRKYTLRIGKSIYKPPKKGAPKIRKLYRIKLRRFTTPEEIVASSRFPQAILEKIEAVRDLPPGERVAEIARIVAENDIYARHCGDFVKRIFKLAGVSRDKIYHNLTYAFVGGRKQNGRWIWKKGPERYTCGDVHYRFSKLISRPNDENPRQGGLKRGDWIWANGYNRMGGGNHSVIFLHWVNKSAGLARVVSHLGGKRGQKVHLANLKKRPVVHISRPA